LAPAYALLGGDRPSSIPFIVLLLENPDSPFALPRKIYLKERDYIHLLLGRGFSAPDEAYVIVFTMGNNLEIKRWHLWVFKFSSLLLYPPKFRFAISDLQAFDLGLVIDKITLLKKLNKFDFALD